MKCKHSFTTCILFIAVCLLSSSPISAQEQSIRVNGKTVKHRPRQATEKKKPGQHPRFRTIDGTLNNLKDAGTRVWGASDIALFRNIDAVYGASDPYNAMGGEDRISPRDISNLLVAQTDTYESRYGLSSLVFTWGQFLDHDITLTPEGHTEYAPIAVAGDDPLFTADIPFFRSLPLEGTGHDAARQQSNLITSWIDASNVYGSEASRASWLRTFKSGKLKTSDGHLLPFNTTNGQADGPLDPDAPSMAGDDGGTSRTFVAGDIRAAEQPGLTALHTLFVREHNRYCDVLIARGLRDDEEIYQEARKYVGALVQSITYREFLPALGIRLNPYRRYEDDLCPDISNLFATAAYRLGHTMVTDEIPLIGQGCAPLDEGAISLVDGFFNPAILTTYGIEPILKGLSAQVQNEIDLMIVDNLRNFLFATPGGTFGLDLAALNLQRGRDHGLPDYNTVRQHYLGQPARSWRDITRDNHLASRLAQTYGEINNVDLWIGLLAEDQLRNASVGPTLNAILGDQFYKLREGDFYYFENDPFLDRRAKDDIQRTSLDDVIRRNTTISDLASDVFSAVPCTPGRKKSLTIDTDMPSSPELTVNPNPADHFILVSYKGLDLSSRWLMVIDPAGRIIVEKTYDATALMNGIRVNLTGMLPGVYFITVGEQSGFRQSQRFIKNKE